jgi:hypothetical protein
LTPRRHRVSLAPAVSTQEEKKNESQERTGRQGDDAITTIPLDRRATSGRR